MRGHTNASMHPDSRFANLADAQQLAELRWLSRSPHERAPEPLSGFAESFSRWLAPALADDPWCIAVSGLPGSHLRGCMYLKIVDKVPTPSETQRAWGYVTNAYVREGDRGVRLGAALLDALRQESVRRELEFLLVWPSQVAVRFYERAGFLPPERERQQFPDDEPAFILHLKGAAAVGQGAQGSP